ncbi:MAG: hypothetical protein EAS51_02690 [Microbacteriaceae bacterium]|nr:MAG: hypothetical protein EAS51_02690 [Microbacteriaceae bacterium]
MRPTARFAAAWIALFASASLVSCAAGPAPTEEDSPAAIEVDESLFTVDITIARSLLDAEGTLTDDEILAAADSKGFSARVEGDSVVYTMTRAQRDDFLSQQRSAARDAADELVADESNSVTSVEFDDGLTNYRVSVDASRYSPFEAFLVVGFYLQGALYQQFAGVDADAVDVTVEFVDDATGEILDSGSYQEMRANLGE